MVLIVTGGLREDACERGMITRGILLRLRRSIVPPSPRLRPSGFGAASARQAIVPPSPSAFALSGYGAASADKPEDVMQRPHAVAKKIVAGIGAWLTLGVCAWAGSPSVVGRVQGLVRDAAGQALSDTSVLAVGQTVVSVRSDAAGRFALSLP